MRPCLLLAFLCITPFAYGQHLHELKTDVVLPFVQIAHLSYEFMPTHTIGIEGNLWFNWDESATYDIIGPGPEPIYTLIDTRLRILVATLVTKYYLFRPAPGSGAYLGAYLREDVLTSRFERQYPYLFLGGYGGLVDNPPKRFQRFATGLQAGYKYVFARHFLAEISLGLDIDPFEKHPFSDWYGIPGVRLGYRF